MEVEDEHPSNQSRTSIITQSLNFSATNSTKSKLSASSTKHSFPWATPNPLNNFKKSLKYIQNKRPSQNSRLFSTLKGTHKFYN